MDKLCQLYDGLRVTGYLSVKGHAIGCPYLGKTGLSAGNTRFQGKRKASPGKEKLAVPGRSEPTGVEWFPVVVLGEKSFPGEGMFPVGPKGSVQVGGIPSNGSLGRGIPFYGSLGRGIPFYGVRFPVP